MGLSELKYALAAKKNARNALKKGSVGEQCMAIKLAVVTDSNEAALARRFHQMQAQLGIPDSDFRLVVCSEDPGEEPRGLHFCSREISLRGQIKNEGIKGFLSVKSEVLIGYSKSGNRVYDFLVENSKAGLKIGREEKSSSLYDLTILSRFDEEEVFIGEAIKYLKILKKIQ